MKKILLLLAFVALASCLYENSDLVTTLTWKTFKTEVMESGEPWYVNFGTDQCNDCKKFVPTYEKAASELLGEVRFGYVDVYQSREIVDFWGIGGMNHQIFLGHYKPDPVGAPGFFSFDKTVENLINFAKNQIFMKKRESVFKGTKFTSLLKTKHDLETQVFKSPDPWFLLFCSRQQLQECLESIFEYDQAAVALKGKVKFGLIDQYASEITEVFGINGTGVCIFLNYEKPGPVGSPALVGSQLLKKDILKYVWDIVKQEVTPEAQTIIDKYSNIPELTYQQIIQHQGALLMLFYTGSDVFGDNELLQKQFDALSKIEGLNSKFKVGKMSVDVNGWMLNHWGIWPVPSIFYVPLNTRTPETIILFDKTIDSEEIKQWAHEQLTDNENDKQIILTRATFESQVMGSQEPWFIQFYTLNNSWCRKCAHLQPEWKKLSNQTQGKYNIAKLNCDNARDICQKFKVWNFPKLVFFPAGNKHWDIEKNIAYEGAFSRVDILKFGNDCYNIAELSQVQHLNSQAVFEKYCSGFNGICFITVLPKEGTSGAQPRDWYIQEIQTASAELSTEPTSFLYFVDGQQPELQERFDLCQRGFPCTIGFEYREVKERGFKTHIKKFSADNLKKNAVELLTEKRGFIPIKKELPPIATVGEGKGHTDL